MGPRVSFLLTHSVSPSSDYKFILAEYLYGDLIIKNGQAQILSTQSNELVPLTDASIHSKI